MAHADSQEGVGQAIARAQSDRCPDVLDPEIGLSSPEPEPAAIPPTVSEAGVELQSSVDQCHSGRNIFAAVTEHVGSVGDDNGVVGGDPERPPNKIEGLATAGRRVIGPTTQLERGAANRCPYEGRGIVWISFNRLPEQVELLDEPILSGGGAKARR